MDKLVDKAKKTNSKIWKWILGVTISVMLTFALWWLKRRYNKLQRLRAEKELMEERQKDMTARAEVEENQSMAKALREEAERAVTRAAELDTRIKGLESDVKEAKKKVDDAKTWKELEE